jgi:hypothetical protein
VISVWEKATHLKGEIKIADLLVHPPRERGSLLMQELVRLNYNSNDLQRLNYMWVHQEVLFLSDIIDTMAKLLTGSISNQDQWVKHGQALPFQSSSPHHKTLNFGGRPSPKSRHSGVDYT